MDKLKAILSDTQDTLTTKIHSQLNIIASLLDKDGPIANAISDLKGSWAETVTSMKNVVEALTEASNNVSTQLTNFLNSLKQWFQSAPSKPAGSPPVTNRPPVTHVTVPRGTFVIPSSAVQYLGRAYLSGGAAQLATDITTWPLAKAPKWYWAIIKAYFGHSERAFVEYLKKYMDTLANTGYVTIPLPDGHGLRFGFQRSTGTLRVEYFQQGGVVKEPTLSVIGETSPEAVLPLPYGERTLDILFAELKSLKEENVNLRQQLKYTMFELAKTNKKIAEILDKWDNIGLPATQTA